MFTRCTGCQAVYELSASSLAEAAGVVRCGNCGKTFNSLSSLFTEHPAEEQAPLAGKGMPPLLEQTAVIQQELPGVSFTDAVLRGSETSLPTIKLEDDAGPRLHFPDAPSAAGDRRHHSLWFWASLVLILALMIQWVWLWQQPGSWLHRIADNQSEIPDAGTAIQVISRDMHRHPTLDDALIISVSMLNQTQRAIAWPLVEIRLYDASQQLLGARRLAPEDYLDTAEPDSRGMPPGVIVPLIAELVVGSTEPSGFELRFH